MAQKAQNFLEKNFRKIFLYRKISYSAEKCKRGPFLIYKHAFCCKITKNSKGGPLERISKGEKNFEKKSHSAEKKSKRGTL